MADATGEAAAVAAADLQEVAASPAAAVDPPEVASATSAATSQPPEVAEDPPEVAASAATSQPPEVAVDPPEVAAAASATTAPPAEVAQEAAHPASPSSAPAEPWDIDDLANEVVRPRALTAPEDAADAAEAEAEAPVLRKSRTVEVEQGSGSKDGKVKRKAPPKKKKKAVTIETKAGADVAEGEAAEEPVESIVPEVIGRSLDITVHAPSEASEAGEAAAPAGVPRRMPPQLPFHFRLDVSAIKIGASFPGNWLEHLYSSLEKEWRYCRKDQERAWINHNELPCEIRDAAQKHQKDVKEIFGKIKQRKEESWQKNLSGRTVRMYPMKVLRFETAPGQELKREDLEGTEEVWCYMIYDLVDDPLLKDIGHEGPECPTIFSALVVLYFSDLEGDARFSREIRAAHIDHFEFALCFPSAPYPSCQLDPPHLDLARCFKLDLSGEQQSLDSLMSQMRPALTWLFWDCFDDLFQVRRNTICKPVPSLARKVRSFVTSSSSIKELHQCQERQQALASLLSIVRAQPFKFPFRRRVSKQEARDHRAARSDVQNLEEFLEGPPANHESLSNDQLDLLAAVELATVKAIGDFTSAMREEGGLLPRQWLQDSPLQLRSTASSSAEKLVEKLTPLELRKTDGTVEQTAQLALIECVGAIKLNRKSRRHEKLVTKGSETELHESYYISSAPSEDGNPSAAEVAEVEEEERDEYDEKEMVLTLDLSNWDGPEDQAELVVGDIDISDHTAIRDVLMATEHLEQLMWQEEQHRPELQEKLSQLAYGLRALQRASMKQQLRSVGLSVLETRRKVPTVSASEKLWARAYERMGGKAEKVELPPPPLQPVLLLSAPEKVLRRRAEVRKLRRRVLPNKADDEFLGGFVRKQFDQEGPLQRYWVETAQMPYAYRPFFQPPAPAIDPAALLSPSERKYLVKSFITDPLSETGSSGTVDPRQGGANMDPRQLLTDGIIEEGLLHLHSHMSAIHLTNGFVYPWKLKGWYHYYFRSWCRCDTALVLHHFGPKIGSYFDFLETYIFFLLIASVLGIVAEISGPPNGRGEYGFWKFIQPCFGVCMSIWGTFFCIFWRRRCARLSHMWGNGWIEDGEDLQGPGSMSYASTRVRPEFALQWRQNFEQAKPVRQEETLKMLKTLLRAPDTPHWDERALTSDIMRFDEACYLSDFVQFYRFILSYLASGCFILLASGATYGALAANQLLGLNGTTGGYAVTGLTTSVLVPLLNVVHYQVVIKTNNYQLFREDREREKDFFDRLFVFNLFNTYNSLLWIAFVERNMDQLRVQVLFLLLSSIFINNLLEFYWSHAVKQLKKMGHTDAITGFRQMLRYIVVGEMDEAEILPAEPIQTALEHVTDETTRDYAFELVDEAIELVIQYGLIMMFTVAFPLAPLLALVNVHIEKRLDSYKLVKLMQSPEPRMVVGMGRAFNAFVLVTGLGLLVSGLLLYFTQYPGEACDSCTMLGNCGACGGTSVELILPEASTEERLFLLAAGEHALLMVMYACFTSASVGKDIIHEQYRQKFYENRLQSMESANDLHRPRRSTYGAAS